MNKTARSVPHPQPAGTSRPPDRRVQRTQRALTEALVALVAEKPYDAITVQDLLDRANVGRSTLYAHYRGKDDLLFRSFERMLDMLDGMLGRKDAPPDRLAPVRELFHHVDGFRPFHRALGRAHMLDRLYQAGADHMTATIARRLTTLRGSDDPPVPPSVAARAYAGALFALLRWWVEHDASYSPERMDELYHGIIGLRTGVRDAPTHPARA